MLRPVRLLVALCLLLGPAETALRGAAEPSLRFVDAFPGVAFDKPLFAAQPPDGTPRMFVAEQDGRIVVLDYPALAVPPVAAKRTFLDISAKVSRRGNEEGLLGFAFHPDFAANGKFYVHYSPAYTTAAGRKNRLAEMSVSAADPDVANPESERVVLEVHQPFDNHNGGWIGFGPDRMLYVALGDGGSGGDPLRNGQDLGTPLAKILRIDVDGAQPYAVPPDNPFVARAGALPETWAYGLRNPWRCSFDRLTGDLWAGDVGQDRFEEVDRIVKGGNYGWSRREAFAAFHSDPPTVADPFVEPLASYDRDAGESITGGYVYRGSRIPSLYGAYVYGDFLSGTVWTLRPAPGVVAPQTADDVVVAEVLHTGEQIASFAEDRAGEILACSFNGRVLLLEADEVPPPAGPFPGALRELGLFADLPALEPAAGALRYSVRSPLWSDGAGKDRFLVLPPGTSMDYRADDAFELPAGAFAVKTFTLRGLRIETRVILRTATGFEAATYRWRDDLADATLVSVPTPVAVTGPGGPQTWTLPSPADCRKCHTSAAGFLLGVTSRQIEPVRGGGDLLARWAADGVLTGDVPPRRVRPAARGIRGRGRLESRVRSYLDANCASCHRPGAPLGAGALDLRAATPLAETGILDVAPELGDLGVGNARLVAPGDPSRSVLALRMRRPGEERMPPVGGAVPDSAAIRTIERWIRRLR